MNTLRNRHSLQSAISPGKSALIIFLIFFLVRLSFKLISGFDNYELHADTTRYDRLSDNILMGNYDLDVVAFLVAPIYPYFLALIKFISGAQWEMWVVFAQLGIVSLSGVYLFKLTELLFEKSLIAWIATALYCFYPGTMWLNFTFTQETLFQSFFIISNYFLLKACLANNPGAYIIAAIWYSFTFLTKSHVLFYAPFIVLIIFISSKYSLNKKLQYSIIFASICLMATLPYGLYNLKENGIYTLSSYGTATFFHNGKSERTFQEIVHPLPLDQKPKGGLLDFIFESDYFHEGYGQINVLPHAEKNKLHLEMALNWIKNNPKKFWELEWYSIKRFFTPGVSPRHFNQKIWLASFLSSLPIYLFGYIGIFLALRTNFKRHFWILSLMSVMMIFFLLFMPQTRFRTITLEPYYIIYAALGIHFVYLKITNLPILLVKN